MALTATKLNVGAYYIWGAIMALTKDEDLLKTINLPKGFFRFYALAFGKTDENIKQGIFIQAKQTQTTNYIKQPNLKTINKI